MCQKMLHVFRLTVNQHLHPYVGWRTGNTYMCFLVMFTSIHPYLCNPTSPESLQTGDILCWFQIISYDRWVFFHGPTLHHRQSLQQKYKRYLCQQMSPVFIAPYVKFSNGTVLFLDAPVSERDSCIHLMAVGWAVKPWKGWCFECSNRGM